MPESGDFFGPLGLGDLETPDKRGRFINIEAIDAYIEKATMETVTITTGTLVDITVSGTSTLNDASIVDATITNADISGGTFGSATIDGDLTVGAWLTMTTSGGVRTASSGQRIEITNADKNIITFYSGDASEKAVGQIVQATNGAGSTRTLQFGTKTPQITLAGDPTDTDATGSFVVRSGSADGSSSAPGFVFAQSAAAAGGGRDLEIRIQNSIPLITDGDITLSAGNINMPAGGAVGFGTSYDDQLYQISDGVLGIKIGGTAIARFSSPAASTGRMVLGTEDNDYIQMDGADESWDFYIDGTKIWALDRTGNESRIYGTETNDFIFNDNVAEEWGFVLDSTEYFRILKSVVIVGAPLFRLPVKGTTGDPTATDQGDMYVNSVDNVLKVYEGGSWRTVATW